MLRPVGLEGDLWHRAVGRPFGGDQFGPFRRAAVEQDHVGMLDMNLVKAIPDQVMVVEVEPAGECDLRPWRQHDLGFSATLGRDEVAGVDHRRRQCAVVHQ